MTTQELQAAVQQDPTVQRYISELLAYSKKRQQEGFYRPTNADTAEMQRIMEGLQATPLGRAALQQGLQINPRSGELQTAMTISPALVAALIGGSALAAGVLAPAAGTTAATAPTAGTTAATVPTLAATTVPGAAAATVPAIAGTTAATTGAAVAPVVTAASHSLWSSPSLWATIIGTGSQLAGSAIAAHAQGEATDTMAAAQDRATQAQLELGRQALQVQQENQRNAQAALSPYRDIGSQALGNLGLQPGASSLGQMNGARPFNPLPLQQVDRTAVGNVQPGQRQVAPTSQPTASSAAPQTLQALSSQQTATSMPQVGEQRQINGQAASWDGRGWSAVGGM